MDHNLLSSFNSRDSTIDVRIGNSSLNIPQAVLHGSLALEASSESSPDLTISPKITKLINEVVNYAKIFYNNLEKKGENKSFQVYQKEYAADGSEVTMKVLPKSKRKIFFSEHRQQLYV